MRAREPQQDSPPASDPERFGTIAFAVAVGARRSGARGISAAARTLQGDNRYYAKLWRNAVYWLTEHSYLGRRRLAVASDKMSYQPGETIQLTAHAFDETSSPATNLRVTVSVLPQSLDAELNSDEGPVRWPDGVERPSGEASPYVVWGEEMEMPARKGDLSYTLELPIAQQLTGGSAAEALRLEVSAYEDTVLIDSTSADVQILDDPFESHQHQVSGSVRPLQIAGQRNTNDGCDPAPIHRVALDYENGASETGCRTDGVANVGPPDFALRDHHSTRRSV